MGSSCGVQAKRTEESARLVGEPIRLGEIYQGEHGWQEGIKPGVRSRYYDGTGIISGEQLLPWCCICLQWPLSAPIWLIVFGCQFCAPCLWPILGDACCYNPSQISYVHSLVVIWQTFRHSAWKYLCCCGTFPALQPGVLFVTTLLATPPRFIFDEDKDVAYLMKLDEYIKAKQSTFPPFSGKYRAIDGGGNNATYTFLGQGLRGYAMNEPYMSLDPSVLPDAAAMQKALQLRSTFKASPFGQNALSTWFANVAIHDFFRSASGSDNKYTGGIDKPWVNLHSSYLDLQVLYGWNKEIADSIRSFSGGKITKVAETRFANSRVPQSSIIVELMRREHNYVCDQLANRYPDTFSTDELLYQQARLIMGGVFINIILRQYGDQMFGENAPDGRGFTELRQQNYGCWPSCVKHAQTSGNHGTFNFNLIYRWHTGIPAEWSARNVPSVKTDEEIRKVLTDELGWASGGFGPNNMPADLFVREISVPAAAVRDARINGAPRLNDFRRRFGLAYTSFEDMTGDPDVARELAKWYPTVEDVELAVGCQVERCMAGGWGLPETVGVAIVADAFSSIRQDRFYTTDYTPEVYTEWGYEHTKTTILVDLANRHLGMNIPRDTMISRLSGWQAPKWSEMSGCYPVRSFDARGFPILK